jgi:hypothetical protein
MQGYYSRNNFARVFVTLISAIPRSRSHRRPEQVFTAWRRPVDVADRLWDAVVVESAVLMAKAKLVLLTGDLENSRQDF